MSKEKLGKKDLAKRYARYEMMIAKFSEMTGEELKSYWETEFKKASLTDKKAFDTVFKQLLYHAQLQKLEKEQKEKEVSEVGEQDGVSGVPVVDQEDGSIS